MFIIIEVLWRLNACQVYVLSKKSINNTTAHLSITPDNFEFSFCNETFKFEPTQIRFKPQTLSGFITEGNSYSFRININNKNYLKQTENKAICYSPKIGNFENIHLRCANCGCVLCSKMFFKRVLPLPSEGCDLSDFFCHNHGDGINTTIDKLQNISNEDCLYGSYYFKINSDYLKDTKCGVVHCKRCLEWLGTKSDRCVKLWNCSVNFSDCGTSEKKTPCLDFYNCVLSIANMSIRPLFKLIANCQITNTSTQYLLLWVMDKNLNILINKESSNSLCEMKVIKVLYVFAEEETDLVRAWLDDPSIETVEVAKQMLIEGMISLTSSTRIIPKSFRQTNNMNVGYLGIPFELLNLNTL